MGRHLAALCVVCAAGLAPVSVKATEPYANSPPVLAAPAERSPSWLGIRLVGEVGGGEVTPAAVPALGYEGNRVAALAVAFGFEGEGWVRPRLGLGLRVSQGFYLPFPSSELTNSYALIEPQVLWRNEPLLFGPRNLFAVSWRASGGLGLASVHTDRACGKQCDEIFARAYRLSGSLSSGVLVSVGVFGIYAGVRFAFDSSVDWSTVLNLGLGVEI